MVSADTDYQLINAQPAGRNILCSCDNFTLNILIARNYSTKYINSKEITGINNGTIITSDARCEKET